MESSSGSNEMRGLAHKLGAAGLRAVLSWQIARAVFRLGFAAAMAIFAGEMIENGTLATPALVGAVIGLACMSCAGIFADLCAARAETNLINDLRAALHDALGRMSLTQIRSRPGGALIAGLQRHPEALASLVISHSAARSMLTLGPLAAAAAVALVSWQAALTLVLAIPVMMIFFALLGTAVRSKAETQERAFGQLAAQFSDRIRTLPTILANHALGREHGKIERRMTAYGDSTMGVLKVAFLNAGVIDLFSALGIALLAVLLGLGHLGLVHVPGFFGLELWQSLFILVIAADFFTPFRRYAEQYHLKAEGEAAAQQLQWYFDHPAAAFGADDKMETTFFTPASVETFDAAKLPAAGLIAISGPSGAGKSTLLRCLAGIEPQPCEVAALPQVAAGCRWIATDIYVPAGTLADALAWNCGAVDHTALHSAAEDVGLLEERLLPGGLDAQIAEGGANLSGGQRMRIGVARVLLADGIVFADEPTAKLDPTTAKLVRRALVEIAMRRLVIVATHDNQLIDAADRHHVLQLQNRIEKAVAA